MPTYGYECKSCAHSFDYFQSMKDEPLKVCPKCGKELRRLITGGTGIIFKGNGFYVTDKGAKNSCSASPAQAKPKADEGAQAAPVKSDAPCAGCAKSDSCPKTSS